MYNLEEIAKTLGFALDDVRIIVTVLIEDAQSSIEQIEQMYTRQAWALISSEAHGIKGSAANMKLTDLSNQALALEEAAKKQDNVETKLYIEAIKSSISKIKESLK